MRAVSREHASKGVAQTSRSLLALCLLLLYTNHVASIRELRTEASGGQATRRHAQEMSNRDKLAVVYLVTNTHFKSTDRISMLTASLRLAEAHLLPTTPAVFYVFTSPGSLVELRRALRPLQRASAEPGRIRVLPVPEDSWVLPAAGNDTAYWHGHWGKHYRLMGDWRLSFMPRFARELGHRYVMQLDDDSYILGKVDQNMVQLFDSRNISLGAQKLLQDWPLVTWGLPELAKYFIMTYQLSPTTLYNHCDPPGLEGLYSALDQQSLDADPEARALGHLFGDKAVPRRGGWDRTILNGNCVMISLDFWFSPLVQRFVGLCRGSGGSVMYRWNEQAVLGMVAQIFATQEQLLLFSFPYAHRLKYKDALRAGGLKP